MRRRKNTSMEEKDTIEKYLEIFKKSMAKRKMKESGSTFPEEPEDAPDTVIFKGIFKYPGAGEKLLKILKNRGSNYKIIKPPVYMYTTGENAIEECVVSANYKGSVLEFHIKYKMSDFFSKRYDTEISVIGKESDRALAEEIFKELWKKGPTIINIEFNFSGAAEHLLDVVKKLAKSYRLIEPKFSFLKERRKFVFKEGIISAEFADGTLKFIIEDKWHGTVISIEGDAKNSIEQILEHIRIKEEGSCSEGSRMFKKVRLTGFSWEDVGGLEKLKEELREVIEWPLTNPLLFKKMHLKVPKGIILYGKPGTGKTLLAKVIACCSKANFFHVSAAELTSEWYGESEKKIIRLFEEARSESPALIFIDEIDALFTTRGKCMHEATRRMLGTFLEQLDGLKELSGVTVLAATNRLEDLDKAIIRPGRFDRIIEVPLPDEKARKAIFRIHTRGMPLENKINFSKLAEMTDGFSGADIEAVCQRAAYSALARYKNVNSIKIEELTENEISKIKISEEDFLDAIKNKLKSCEVSEKKSGKKLSIGFHRNS
jgi:ATP-dependent 26S proteasome regulatory subunit